MEKPFNVSVIIPVYNAEKFINRAVESAVVLEEVKEIILVFDGSPDNSLSICKKLALNYEKVKLFHHQNFENKGAGASRNLGIQNSECNFISFLDADDYFLPNRFKNTKYIFEKNPKVEAVYEAVGTVLLDDSSRIPFSKMKNIAPENVEELVSFVKYPLEGPQFFNSLIKENNGYPCTDGITIRRKLIEKAGFFNEKLRLHQDSEYWIRLSYEGWFAPGGTKDDIVAVRGVHSGNRITTHNIHSKHLYYKAVFSWIYKKKVPISIKFISLKKYFKLSIMKYRTH
jgi:glycosyltransferase involved in cell wall biosynthesis